MKADAAGTKNTGTLAKKLRRDWNLNKWKYIMIIPVLIYLVLFCYKPMYGLIIAFKDYKITRGIAGSSWADPWFKWFLNFITDPYFPRVIKNTFMISGLTILFGFPTPIILALLINEVRNKAFKRSVQTITYMPYFISTVVMCGIIKVFCMQDGLFAQIASAFGGVAENYLANPRYFRTIYVASDIWQKIGWDSIIYLAALSAIDQEQYEAARVDGANRFQQMLHITLPGLIPTIMILFILRMGNILNVGYEKVLLLYNATTYEVADIISTYTYRLSFPTSGGSPMYSKSTAIGLFNTLVNVVFLLITNAISKKATESSLF
jgi:putative aldouronate transport system permease protein